MSDPGPEPNDSNLCRERDDDADEETEYVYVAPSLPSKRKKLSDFRSTSMSLNDGCDKVFAKLHQGGFKTYVIAKNGKEDAFFNGLQNAIKHSTEFAQKWNLIYVASRCISRFDKNILFNPTTKTGDKFARQAVVRIVESSKCASRRECAEAIAGFLNRQYWYTRPLLN